jgi:hypothetical protein
MGQKVAVTCRDITRWPKTVITLERGLSKEASESIRQGSNEPYTA